MFLLLVPSWIQLSQALDKRTSNVESAMSSSFPPIYDGFWCSTVDSSNRIENRARSGSLITSTGVLLNELSLGVPVTLAQATSNEAADSRKFSKRGRAFLDKFRAIRSTNKACREPVRSMSTRPRIQLNLSDLNEDHGRQQNESRQCPNLVDSIENIILNFPGSEENLALTNKTTSQTLVPQNRGLRTLPPEIRREIFSLVLDREARRNQMAPLVCALLGDWELVEEALAIYYRKHVYRLCQANNWSLVHMKPGVPEKLERISVSLG